jgi:hypothetical protein
MRWRKKKADFLLIYPFTQDYTDEKEQLVGYSQNRSLAIHGTYALYV